ncbi:cofactor-independent phosphoglycerate mutase [bacterium]|nr:cofactor-independent phosphoglycerate mutase [bacterium]|tara:strand:- start:69 stop:1211 length:1143 start_codon:yes stop_codon:yes gene_type:complete
MKYIVCLGDGMSDWPIEGLGNQTPLAYAKTPNMDALAAQGRVGVVDTVEAPFYPGSDVANMGILGYDPAESYTGRAAIESAAMGVDIPNGYSAFRCNLVTISNETMVSFTAHHIETAAAARVLDALNQHFDGRVQFYVGASYRHIAVMPGAYPDIVCTPPHDLTDKPVVGPSEGGAAVIQALMTEAQAVVQSVGTGATDIWLWSPGTAVNLPTFHVKHGLTGGVVSAVDVVKGLGCLMGMHVPDVPGATGFLDTNYAGKWAAATAILETSDFVYVHVEAPDECGHLGDVDKKVQAIEDFDAHIIGPARAYLKANPDTRIMVLPDHATPCAIKTHSREAVPVVLAGLGIASNGATKYSEAVAVQTDWHETTPWALFKQLIC